MWQRALAQVAAHAQAHGAHLARTVVLVPYAQLMPWAQRHWALQFPQGFAPRFETTRNWARQLQVFEPSADDFAGDVARDTLTARALLDRVGQGAQREMLATPLQEAAAQLAPAVAAVPPAQRAAWGDEARKLLATADEGSSLHYEALVTRLALEWVLASRHATDVLFEPGVRAAVDALVVLEGFQSDALPQALLAHWGEQGLVLRCQHWSMKLPRRQNALCMPPPMPKTKPTAPLPACWPMCEMAGCPSRWPPPTAH
ncbi:MAG: hypothetical protein ACLGIY_06290 [Betaproteobacteria bacterium]